MALAAGRWAQAEALAHRLLEQQPDDPETLQLLALAVARLGREAEAIAYLERAAHSAPGHAQCHYNLAVTCQKAGFEELAILSYRNTVRLQPRHGDALWNLGDMYRLNEHFAEAVECFERLVRIGRIYLDLHHRLAVALHGLREDDRALHHFDLALAGNSTDPALTRWEQSHTLLALGRFEAGWEAYSHRFEVGALTGVRCHDFPFPRWQGESLAGKHLLVHGEQGLGDEIMFGSILPELLAEAGQLTFACKPPLVRLFGQSMPALAVHRHTVGGETASVADIGPVDYQIPVCSLGAIRRRSRDAFGRGAAYLRADPRRRDYFESKLAALAPDAGGKLKAGIVWGANPAHKFEGNPGRVNRRSIGPALLAPLAALRDRVVFVSLHNHELAGQAAHAPALDILDFHRDLFDMADTAALIDTLDVVISVDTSVAHLAGALGRRTWVLLMERCEWRWLTATDTSPWYPEMRLFRQPNQGDWQAVVDHLTTALAALVGDSSAPQPYSLGDDSVN